MNFSNEGHGVNISL